MLTVLLFLCHISCHTFVKNSTVYSKTLQNTVKQKPLQVPACKGLIYNILFYLSYKFMRVTGLEPARSPTRT